MKKWIITLLFFSLAVPLPVSASLSKHIVDYQIKARLDPEEKTVTGQQILIWLNDSEVPVSELQFHLYLNAFKNNRSTFMIESGGESRNFKMDEKHWGFINVKSIGLLNGPDLTEAMQFIHPDDENEEDRTVMSLSLPESVQPQEKVTLEIEFYAKLPKVFARSGFYDDFFMVAQWFPKIGVFQEGGWNCHQYHANSEFFADFGVYEVEITVPEDFIVGATGKRTSRTENEDRTITYTHYQEDVHDFAWTASPNFIEVNELFTLDEPKVNTEMIFLIQKEHKNLTDRYISSLRNGLEFYSTNYGAYPYETITLVDPPLKAMGAGGMEYPTLFTAGGASFIPEGLKMTEMVTIHEFGHNFWYGMVASNEFEEPWLDEGFNSYSEVKAMTLYYGKDTSMMDLFGLKIGDFHMQRMSVMGSSPLDPILKKSWEFYSGGSYGSNSYAKAAFVLLTLENYLGDETMNQVMKTYFERWRFRHPTTRDFIDVAEEVSGMNLDWFFDQFLKTPGTLDYAVSQVRSEEVNEPKGIFDEGEALPKEEEKKQESEDKNYKNTVTVVRRGEWIFPQDVLIKFEDGEETRESWNGQDRWKRFIYYKPVKLKSAVIDPDNKAVLDINYLNNSRLREPEKASVTKHSLSLMLFFQKILSFMVG
ncbi:MAG: M1 family metallopeptidase [Candidatus Aminicenantes bacterium]